MKKIIIFLLFGAVIGNHTQSIEESKNPYLGHMAALYIDNLPETRKYLTEEIKNRYILVILQASDLYDLNPLFLARQIERESRFKWWAQNNLPALGPMGVRPKFWNHVLFRIPDPPPACDPKYFQRIGYGVFSGAYILRHYLDKFDNDYKLALLAYWAGPNSQEFKTRQFEKYVNKVIYATEEEE